MLMFMTKYDDEKYLFPFIIFHTFYCMYFISNLNYFTLIKYRKCNKIKSNNTKENKTATSCF